MTATLKRWLLLSVLGLVVPGAAGGQQLDHSAPTPAPPHLHPNQFIATHALTGQPIVITGETGTDGHHTYHGVPEGDRVVGSTTGDGQVRYFVTPVETQSFP
ncbi:MAG: hypothetical protein ACREJ9_15435 [Candidatus Rokuibacteriota bacterium]